MNRGVLRLKAFGRYQKRTASEGGRKEKREAGGRRDHISLSEEECPTAEKEPLLIAAAQIVHGVKDILGEIEDFLSKNGRERQSIIT